MLGSLIIGDAGVREQEIARVTAATQLGPMIITPEDQARALEAAGLTAETPAVVAPTGASLGAPDTGLTVREIRQQLKANPASVGDILKAEAERLTQGLEVRASVLKEARAVALARGESLLVQGVDALLDSLGGEE